MKERKVKLYFFGMGCVKLSPRRVDPVLWKRCLWQADSEHVTSLVPLLP